MADLVPIERIADKILLIRGEKVMLDRDLAELYGVETAQLKRNDRRNIERFPEDFMFILSKNEFENLRCHFGTSSWGGTRYPPMAFTEQGVAMLSSVLRSKRAVEINILIVRAFVRLRALLSSNKELVLRVERLEREMKTHGDTLSQVVEIVTQLLNPPEEQKRKIGF